MGCSLPKHKKSKPKASVRTPGLESKLPPPKPAIKASTEIGSILLIQRWYRRCRARLEFRRQSTWTIFQNIEYAGEQNQLKLYNFFTSIMEEFAPTDLTDHASVKKLISQSTPDLDHIELEKITVGKDYKGPVLTFPLTTEQIRKLIAAFSKHQDLHSHYLVELLLEVKRQLKSRENIHFASTSISKHITVCGDLHGSWEDLMVIFSKNGLPTIHNPYVFNGDFVDRGEMSIEVVTVLFAFFVCSPNSMYLNRGNHEDHIMNCRYGFVKEIALKYPNTAPLVTNLFADVFSWLPFLTIIDEKVMVVHGGISENTNFRIIGGIERHKYQSLLQPPPESDDSDHDMKEWVQLLDLLWSDPRAQAGCVPNTYRGGGCYFGPDVSAKWLKNHRLQLLIRSHECKQEGYEYTHNGLVLTVFSASNYYERGSNKGAYVTMDAPHLQPRVVQYLAQPAADGAKKPTLVEKVDVLESSALQDLQQKIISHKIELVRLFEAQDTKKTGYVTQAQFSDTMTKVMAMPLPWRLLGPKLAKVNDKGWIQYATLFQNLHIESKYASGGANLTEVLYQHKDSLETIFRLFDQDNSGAITMEEFAEACQIITRHTKITIPPDQIKDLGHSLDLNKDGLIDFNEFLEAFRIVDNQGQNFGRRRASDF